MPQYLVHGFRWGRVKIRHYVILNSVDDGMPEYIMSAVSTKALLDSFAVKWPDIMDNAPKIRFVEQYDPANVTSAAQSQPYAFVCDTVIKGGLSVDVDQIRTHSMGAAAWQTMADLRDVLDADAEMGWFAVYNGDEERADFVLKDDLRPEVGAFVSL